MFLTVLYNSYKIQMSLLLLMLGCYLYGETIGFDGSGSLYASHGPVSLVFPLLFGVPIVALCVAAYKRARHIMDKKD